MHERLECLPVEEPSLGTSGKTAGTYPVRLTLYAGDNSVVALSDWQYLVLRS